MSTINRLGEKTSSKYTMSLIFLSEGFTQFTSISTPSRICLASTEALWNLKTKEHATFEPKRKKFGNDLTHIQAACIKYMTETAPITIGIRHKLMELTLHIRSIPMKANDHLQDFLLHKNHPDIGPSPPHECQWHLVTSSMFFYLSLTTMQLFFQLLKFNLNYWKETPVFQVKILIIFDYIFPHPSLLLASRLSTKI